MKVQILKTKDGSDTLFVPELNQNYHSINGAKAESLHVYIESGLKHIQKDIVRILEFGFGTGLNAILTYSELINSKQRISYTTIEKFPLSLQTIRNLNYCEDNSQEKEIYLKIHESEWEKYIEISENFSFLKLKVDFVNFKSEKKYDLIYFDAFAPDIQPELWTKDVFQNIYNHMTSNAILVTYSSKGIVKQALRDVGFSVKRLPGPTGKRHILRAKKL